MQSSSTWRWVYHPETSELVIQLDDGLEHRSPYKASRLAKLHSMNAAFSLADAEVFQMVSEALEDAGFAFEQALQTGLNAAILQRFGRPQMPQSWFFQQQDQTTSHQPPAVGEIMLLNSGFAEAPFIVLECESEFAVAMLITEQMQLSEIKHLKNFDTIKVLHNRLQPLNAAVAEYQQRLA